MNLMPWLVALSVIALVTPVTFLSLWYGLPPKFGWEIRAEMRRERDIKRWGEAHQPGCNCLEAQEIAREIRAAQGFAPLAPATWVCRGPAVDIF